MIAHPYPQFDETVYEAKLSCGLTVHVLPRPGFAKKCACIAVNYGSNETSYTWKGQKFRSPDGVAHYLEHKMFDMEGRDIMTEFSALGANPNAFTSYNMTAYYFTCTQHFEKCLDLLLTFVSTPYYTQETVDKERGIIAQEIRMYADSADSQVYEDLFAAAYRHHPVKVPIAGSVESIQEITPDILYGCYEAFYRPENMVLTVVGDVDPQAIEEAAEGYFKTKPEEAPVRDYGPAESPTDIPQKLFERTMDVAMPTVQIGFKTVRPENNVEALKMQVLGDLSADVMMGESSPLYLKLYKQGLLDSSFASGYEDLPGGVALFSCGGDTKKPEALKNAILDEAKRIAAEGVEEELFQSLKRAAIGRRVRSLDSMDGACFRLCTAYFDEFPYLDFPQLYEPLTKAHVERFITETITEDRCCMAVVWPRNQEAE